MGVDSGCAGHGDVGAEGTDDGACACGSARGAASCARAVTLCVCESSGFCVSACWFVPPQCGFSFSLLCTY